MWGAAALAALALGGMVPARGQVFITPVAGATPIGLQAALQPRLRAEAQPHQQQQPQPHEHQPHQHQHERRRREPYEPPFRYVPGGNINPAPVVGDSGRVFVGTGRHALYALDRATGKMLWSFQPKGDVTASPGVGPDGTVYVTSYDHAVYALDGATGAKKWQFLTGDLVSTTPAVGANGLVYVGGYDKTLYALDTSGLKKWEFKTGRGRLQPHARPGRHGLRRVGQGLRPGRRDGQGCAGPSPTTSSATTRPLLDAKSGTLYVGAHDGTVYALDAATGAKRWQYATGNSVESAPALGADGTLYVGADKLYALWAASGRVRWTFGSGAHNWSGAAVGADGTVYAGCANGSVYAVSPTTGLPRWGFPTGDSLITAPAVGPDGNVFLASAGTGRVYALNPRSGRVFWQFAAAAASVAGF